MNENPPTANPPPPAAPGNGTTSARLNSPWFLWPATAALAGLLYVALFYLNSFLTQESTDDAFIEGHVVSVAPRVAGQVLTVRVLDNQFVHSNDLLVEIDPATYAMTTAQKQSSADAQESSYKAALAALDLMSVKVVTAQATADQSKADADAAAATDARAQADFQRNQELRNQNTISAQEFDAAQAAAREADANLIAARQKAAADASKISEARAQLDATKAAVGMALAQFRQAQTTVQSAQLDLSYTKIFAPADGRVTRKAVEAGDYVQTGQTLLSIVPNDVWVVANFKETQLKHMKPGQRAMVSIDALDRSFAAHVDSVQAGSGAAFSLLPPENATGNYVKVVQRVPVKIVFDEPLPADHTVGPGLSVVPDVSVGALSLPRWALAVAAILLAGATATGFRMVLGRKANNKPVLGAR
ncbi:MAG: HlyD family secretion protein [Limisphaerales bacterium]